MQITEQILTAIDTIVSERLNTVNYDTTITCTVIGIEDAILNTYRVRHNNVSFIAKATNEMKYESDDQVSVVLPNNDYNAPDKIIIGNIQEETTSVATWQEPLTRLLPYVTIKQQNNQPINLTYTKSTEPIVSITLTPDAKIWTQFTQISSMGIFKYIGLKADIYAYFETEEILKGMYWFDVKFLDAEGHLLHGLVNNEISPVVFLSNEIDGNPFSQPIATPYSALRDFPEEISNPENIAQIQITLGVNSPNANPDVPNLFGLDTGIYINNIELIFGYDIEAYKNEGIMLAIPRENANALEDGYLDSTQRPNITAWVMKDDQTGLFMDEDLSEHSELDNALRTVSYWGTMLPRFVNFNDQRDFILEKIDDAKESNDANNLQLRLAVLQTNNGPELEIIADLYSCIMDMDIATATNETLQNILIEIKGLSNSLIKAYWPEAEERHYLTNKETQDVITKLFALYEKMIKTYLDSIELRKELRWYYYKFGATQAETDSFGGGYWIPIGEHPQMIYADENDTFKYHLGTTLESSLWNWSANAETKIKALLCQEGYTTSASEEEIPVYESKAVNFSKVQDKVISFTNAAFTQSNLITNDYLTIEGQTFVSLYNYNYELCEKNVTNGYNNIRVGFKDNEAKKDMLLGHLSTVKWEILNSGMNQIDYLLTPTIYTQTLNEIWNDCYDPIFNLENQNRIMQYQYDQDEMDLTEFTRLVRQYLIDHQDLSDCINAALTIYNKLLSLFCHPSIELRQNYHNECELLSRVASYLINAQKESDYSSSSQMFYEALPYFAEDMYNLWPILCDYWSYGNESTKPQQFIFDYGHYDEEQDKFIEHTEYWNAMMYKPKNSFVFNNVDTIRCSFDKFYADIAITFGLIGTQGTDYIFSIEPIVETPNSYFGILNKAEATQKYRAILRDKNGKIITDLSHYNIKWKWKSKSVYPQLYKFNNNTKTYEIFNRTPSNQSHTDSYYLHYQTREPEQGMASTIYYTFSDKKTEIKYMVNTQEDCITIQNDSGASGEVELKLNRKFRAQELKDFYWPNNNTYGPSKNNWDYALLDAWRYKLIQQGFTGITQSYTDSDFPTDTYEHYFTDTSAQPNLVGNHVLRYSGDPENDAIAMNNHVLEATCEVPVVYMGETDSRSITLTAVLPIAIYDTPNGSTLQAVSGEFALNWNEQGKILYDNSTAIPYSLTYKTASNSINWELYPNTSGYSLSSNKLQINNKAAWPSSPLYITATRNGKLLYQTTIMSYLNSYSSNVTNQWSGAGIIMDDNEGVILTAQIGAGRKDPITNKFTGVLLGDVEVNNEIRNGIYGFGDGINTFGIDAQTGEAYFKGRIESSYGRIGEWLLTPEGLESATGTFFMHNTPQYHYVDYKLDDIDYRDKLYLSLGQPANDYHGQPFNISADGLMYAQKSIIPVMYTQQINTYPQNTERSMTLDFSPDTYTRRPALTLTGQWLWAQGNDVISSGHSSTIALGQWFDQEILSCTDMGGKFKLKADLDYDGYVEAYYMSVEQGHFHIGASQGLFLSVLQGNENLSGTVNTKLYLADQGCRVYVDNGYLKVKKT